MGPQNADSRPLRALIVDTLQKDIRTADRITEVVTRAVPWQFPGRLLRALSTLAPAPVDRERLEHATVSVEYVCLHQYLHAISRTREPLASPAGNSRYAEDPILSILDGDSLQAYAFSHLTDVTDDPEMVERYYDLVSTRSIACYERSTAERRDTPVMALSPMAGVAARLGARLGGMSRSRAETIEPAAAVLGRAIPVRTPSGWQAQTVTSDAAVEAVVEAVGDTPKAAERIGALVRAEQQSMQ